MSAGESDPGRTTLLQSGLEVRSRLVLEEGLSRIDARTRSRLNQARQAAVAAAASPSWLARLLGALDAPGADAGNGCRGAGGAGGGLPAQRRAVI